MEHRGHVLALIMLMRLSRLQADSKAVKANMLLANNMSVACMHHNVPWQHQHGSQRIQCRSDR